MVFKETFLVIVLFAAIGDLAFAPSCPHGAFVAKHMCSGIGVSGAQRCAAESRKARLQNGWWVPNTNDIFMAPPGFPMEYRLDNYRCIFKRKVENYVCVYQEDSPASEEYQKWKCNSRGVVIAEHDVYSGHFGDDRYIHIKDRDEDCINRAPGE